MESLDQGAHHCVEDDCREGVTLIDSNLERDLRYCPCWGSDCYTEVGVEVGHNADQLTGCVIVSECELYQLVVDTSIGIGKI